MSFDPVSYAMGKRAAGGGGGGGGNPNYIETISGTLDAPFGSMAKADIKALLDATETHDVTLILGGSDWKESSDYGDAVMQKTANYYIFAAPWPIVSEAGIVGSVISYTYTSRPGLKLSHAQLYSPDGSLTDIDPTTPCTLTIIHHPLPNQS